MSESVNHDGQGIDKQSGLITSSGKESKDDSKAPPDKGTNPHSARRFLSRLANSADIADSTPTEPEINFIQINRKLITTERPVETIVRNRRQTQPDHIEMPWATLSERSVREDALEPSARLKQGFTDARNFINTVRSNF